MAYLPPSYTKLDVIIAITVTALLLLQSKLATGYNPNPVDPNWDYYYDNLDDDIPDLPKIPDQYEDMYPIQEEEEKVEVKEETYADIAVRLKCDNPWLWNAIKCAYVDVKGNMVGERTKRNGRTSAIIVGVVVILLILWTIALYCVYLFKFKDRYELYLLRKRMKPGQIQLASGKMAKYDSTDEEIKAYEQLVRAIIIQETASQM